ncbi:MAG: thiamine pyrophosphate-dependent enzyme, partial [Bacillota bacterium]|nr:thiamine pyrophosphate-dependent enzyme [Bacillota bacterium]
DVRFSEAVTTLAAQLNYPILADPLSQLRSGSHVSSQIIDTYDTFLRNDDAKALLKPDLVIRFGALPVSKALTIFLKENHQAVQLVVDGAGGWRDPSFLSTDMVYCNETRFCRQIMPLLHQKGTAGFLEKWQSLNTITKENMSIVKDYSHCSESNLFYQLADLLPERATLFVGNSMPIRDIDSFFHCNEKEIKVLANRGVNGIDGTISAALGAAVYAQPLYLVLGDLTFFHDLNGLLAAKLYQLNITIIVINNNGGGIFSFLPQSQHPKHFELLFGTPLDLDFEHVVRMYNGKFTRIEEWDEFVSTMKESDVNKGLNVIEVMTNRDKSLEEHREMWDSVSREITNTVNGEVR